MSAAKLSLRPEPCSPAILWPAIYRPQPRDSRFVLRSLRRRWSKSWVLPQLFHLSQALLSPQFSSPLGRQGPTAIPFLQFCLPDYCPLQRLGYPWGGPRPLCQRGLSDEVEAGRGCLEPGSPRGGPELMLVQAGLAGPGQAWGGCGMRRKGAACLSPSVPAVVLHHV